MSRQKCQPITFGAIGVRSKHPHFWSYETPYFGKTPVKSAEATFRALKSLRPFLEGKISTLPKNGKGSFRLSMDVLSKNSKFLDSYMSAFDASNTTLSAVRLRAILDHWSDTHAWNVAFHTPSKRPSKSPGCSWFGFGPCSTNNRR